MQLLLNPGGLPPELGGDLGPLDPEQCLLGVEPRQTYLMPLVKLLHLIEKGCIPLDLRLQAVNWSVGEVVQRCRDVVLSRHLVHHSAFAGRAKPGDKLRLHTITAAFPEARDKAGLTWPAGKTPPTFHEIRSTAARLYAEQGIDAQALLGHKSPDMTALYRDVRGSEWIEIRLG